MSDDPNIDDRMEARQKQLEQRQQVEQHSENLSQDKKQVAGRKYNADFFSRIADSDLESEHPALKAIEEELPATFSSAHITGQRRKTFEARQDLLNRAKAERVVTEHSPGADLRRRPGLHAVARGDSPEIQSPSLSGTVDVDTLPEDLDPSQKRVYREAIREVATTQQSLAVAGTGLKQFTSATSETHQVKHDSEDDGWLSSAMGVFR